MPEPLNPQDFRRACGQFATGITIVTLLAPDGEPHGITVNSFTSVSLSPPLVLVCIDKRSSLITWFRPGAAIAINVLSDCQQELSARFAKSGVDRFAATGWRAGSHGVPLFPGTLAALEARVTSLAEGGDHVIVVAEVEVLEWNEGRPLLYFNSAYQRLES